MEVYELTGYHVFTGKDVRILFLLVLRKNQRPIDVILDTFDLGGIHVKKLKKITKGRLPRAIAIDSNIRVVGRR